MANLYRMRTELIGFPGGPGVSTMYFLDVDTALDSVHTFWAGVAVMMPADVTIRVDSFGDVIDEATGEIVDAWRQSETTDIVGSAIGNYAAPCGVLLSWLTSTIVDGRRVKGHTFVVPITATNLTADGKVGAPSVALAVVKASQLVAAQSASFVIWHRPRKDRPATGRLPHLPAHAGSHALVTSAQSTQKVAILSSRR